MGFTFKVKVILKNINQEFNLTLPFGLTPPTGPRTGGVLRAAPAVGPRALRPCPLPDRLLRSLRQRVGPKGAARGPVLGPRGPGGRREYVGYTSDKFYLYVYPNWN